MRSRSAGMPYTEAYLWLAGSAMKRSSASGTPGGGG